MGKRQFVIPTDEEVKSLSSKSGFIIPTDEEVSSLITQKKNPNQNASLKSTELSGATSSTDGEDESWLTSPFRLLGGGAKAIYSKAVDFLEGSMRNVAASGLSAGTTAPTVTMKEAPKAGEIKKNIETFDKTTGKFFESIRPEIQGSADVFTKDGMRIPDAEAAGFQIGDGLAQLGLNFLGPVGLAVNFFSNAEKNYKEARKEGISSDRALGEGALRASAETLLDKFLGAERAIGAFAGKQAAKIGTS
jgi:hypothetical protein